MGARRGVARVGRCLAPPQKNFVGYIGSLNFATVSSYGGLFATFFSHFLGSFHHVGTFLLFFTSWWGAFFGLAPPPYENFCGRPRLYNEGSRAFSPEIFLCDRNLVSSGHVLLRFCLKNDKNNDKL